MMVKIGDDEGANVTLIKQYPEHCVENYLLRRRIHGGDVYDDYMCRRMYHNTDIVLQHMMANGGDKGLAKLLTKKEILKRKASKLTNTSIVKEMEIDKTSRHQVKERNNLIADLDKHKNALPALLPPPPSKRSKPNQPLLGHLEEREFEFAVPPKRTNRYSEMAKMNANQKKKTDSLSSILEEHAMEIDYEENHQKKTTSSASKRPLFLPGERDSDQPQAKYQRTSDEF